MDERPIDGKAYDKIPHLPGSRFARSDRWFDADPVPRLVHRASRGDRIVVTEKLDGSCVAVANVGGVLVPLLRSGLQTALSRFEQHGLFTAWVWANVRRFAFLSPGERVVGEWLAQAHGTRYDLVARDPFVAFDLFDSAGVRQRFDELIERLPRRSRCTIDSSPGLSTRLTTRQLKNAHTKPVSSTWFTSAGNATETRPRSTTEAV